MDDDTKLQASIDALQESVKDLEQRQQSIDKRLHELLMASAAAGTVISATVVALTVVAL